MSRALLLSVLAAAALAACHREPAAIRALTLDEVQQRLGRAGVFVFDANPIEMYRREHLPGAKWVEWDHVAAGELPSDRAAELIFYCANEWCTASHESAQQAVQLGYAHVAVMPAGVLGWKKSGRPIEAAR